MNTKVVFRFHQKQNAFAQVEVDPITWSKPETTLSDESPIQLPKKMRYRNYDLDVVHGINYEAPWKNSNKAGVALRASVDIIAWSTPDVGECESGIPIVHLVPQGSSLDFNIEAADSDGLSEFIPSLKRVPQKSRDEGFMF